MSPKPQDQSQEEEMLERRRRPQQHAVEEADEEMEVLRGGQTKAIEDEKKDEEGQVQRSGSRGVTSRGGGFLTTPSQPALQEGVGKTPRLEETPAQRTEEWKTPTPAEKPQERGSQMSSTRKDGNGRAEGAQTSQRPTPGAPPATEPTVQWHSSHNSNPNPGRSSTRSR